MKDELVHIQSGGRRISLYAQIGEHFYPDGELNEAGFRVFIKMSLEQIQDQQTDTAVFEEEAGKWLSDYLAMMIGYLKEKEMPRASLLLFSISIDESARLGIKNVSIPPEHLQFVLSSTTAAAQSQEQKFAPSEKRKRIFDAALKLYVEKGFHETTVEEIANLSGVGKGTVYRIFKNKQDLLDQLLKDKNQEIVNLFSKALSQGDDILEQVQKVIELWMLFIEKNHMLYKLIQSEEIYQRSDKRSMFYDTIISNLPMIKERIVSLNYEKKLKTTSFYTVFYGVLGFIDGVVQKWFRSNMSYSLRDEVPVVLEVLFNGFVGVETSGKSFYVPPEDI
jgi:AcrR family transcriptional regulator